MRASLNYNCGEGVLGNWRRIGQLNRDEIGHGWGGVIELNEVHKYAGHFGWQPRSRKLGGANKPRAWKA